MTTQPTTDLKVFISTRDSTKLLAAGLDRWKTRNRVEEKVDEILRAWGE
jgi:hypothetical protein